MDHQLGLISEAVLNGTFNKVIDHRITSEHFTDEQYQRVFDYVQEHWSKYGNTPGAEIVEKAFPTFVLERQEQPLEFFINGLHQHKRAAVVTAALYQASDLMSDEEKAEEKKFDEITDLLKDALEAAAREGSGSRDINVPDALQGLEQVWKERAANPGHLRGISTGIHGIDLVTGGWQKEQLVTLIGLPKAMKSSIMLYMAWKAWMAGQRVLFVGFEMSNDEQLQRLSSLILGVSLTTIQNGTYTKPQRIAAARELRRLKDSREWHMSSDITETSTVQGVQAKVREYNPDVIFVDGAYLMDPGDQRLERGSSFALTAITRDFKRLAQTTMTPVVLTTQASTHRSKGGVTAASVMYSTSFLQDSDVVLSTERLEETGALPTDPVMLKISVLLSRSGPKADTLLEWDWGSGSVKEHDPEGTRELTDDDED